MEDVLAVYTRPRDPNCPLVCLDETSKQLIAETRLPIAMKAGRPARFDYEYARNGTANLFMMFAPLEGWRQPPAIEAARLDTPTPPPRPRAEEILDETTAIVPRLKDEHAFKRRDHFPAALHDSGTA
jgi:hypothetical protein